MVKKTADKRITDSMNFVFYAGIVVLFLIIMVFIIVHNDIFFRLVNYIPKCTFHETTGFDCPGCGVTRACIAIAKFHFLESLKYNIIVLYSLICYVVFMAVQGRHILHGTKAFSEHIFCILIYIGVAIIIIQFIVKLIFRLSMMLK